MALNTDQHLLDRDDGQVGGAVPGRRVPATERGAHGAERGGVGQVHVGMAMDVIYPRTRG
jgi:hypothetical protein